MASSSNRTAIKRAHEASSRIQKILDTTGKPKKGKETLTEDKKESDTSLEDIEDENTVKKESNKMLPGETGDAYFQRIYKQETEAQVYFEYLKFLKEFPAFETHDLKEIVDKVKHHLKIDYIESKISFLDLNFKSDDINNTPVLDALSAKLGFSLNILAPPTKTCLLCYRPLTNKYPGRKTLTALFTLCGPKLASKLILTCRNCPSARKVDSNSFGGKEQVTYLPDRFGNASRGFKFYPKYLNVKVVGASRESFFKKDVCSGYWEEFSHGWLSAETKAESYNMSFKDTENVARITKYLEFNPNQGSHFDKANKRGDKEQDGDEEDDNEDEEENYDHEENLKSDHMSKRKVSRIFEMKRKQLNQAVKIWCVLEELQDRGLYFIK